MSSHLSILATFSIILILISHYNCPPADYNFEAIFLQGCFPLGCFSSLGVPQGASLLLVAGDVSTAYYEAK
jgi:hypothetical protein